MATRYYLKVPKKYTKDGQEKTAWKEIGTLVYFPASGDKTEGFICELHLFPDLPIKVFPEKDREQQTGSTAPAQDPLRAFDAAIDSKDLDF